MLSLRWAESRNGNNRQNLKKNDGCQLYEGRSIISDTMGVNGEEGREMISNTMGFNGE